LEKFGSKQSARGRARNSKLAALSGFESSSPLSVFHQDRLSPGFGLGEDCQIAECSGIDAKQIPQLIERNREFVCPLAFRRFHQIPYPLQGFVEALARALD
jgi:hypothetical protein